MCRARARQSSRPAEQKQAVRVMKFATLAASLPHVAFTQLRSRTCVPPDWPDVVKYCGRPWHAYARIVGFYHCGQSRSLIPAKIGMASAFGPYHFAVKPAVPVLG